MAKTKWVPAEDELLVMMVRKGHSFARCSSRLDCTEEEAKARHALLTAKAAIPPENAAKLPSPEEVSKLMEAMDPLQKEFMLMCSAYNELGVSLKNFSTLVSSALAEPELEKVLIDAFQYPRQPGETIYQKLARLLAKDFIVVPKPKVNANPPQTSEGINLP